MKKIFLMLLIACFSVGVANAQFGKLKGLAKKAKQAVEQVDKSKAKAEKAQQSSTVVQEINKEAEKQAEKQVTKTSKGIADDEYIVDHYGYYEDKSVALKGDNLGIYKKARKTDWNELQTFAFDGEDWHPNIEFISYNGLYYVYRWNEAVENKDTEKMTGELLRRVSWCISQLMKMNAAQALRGLDSNEFKQLVNDYNKATEGFSAIIWTGKPSNPMTTKERTTPEKKVEYTQNAMKVWDWCLDKAQAAQAENKPVTAEFYIEQALGYRYANIAWGYATGTEPGFAEFDARMGKLYANTSSEFKGKNKFLTVPEVQAAQQAEKERWAKEKAEKEAARLAEIESKTEDWPKSNMPELDAQILRIVRAKFPDRKITRVSVMNNKWNVMMKGLVPERRVVQFWMEYYHKEAGRVIAEEHYVCQYYNGTYGKTQYQSQGSRYFWVRQK